MKVKIIEYPEKFSDYVVENVQLYRTTSCGNCASLAQECHEAPTAGHLGVRKTVSRLSQGYLRPGMFRDAQSYA